MTVTKFGGAEVLIEGSLNVRDGRDKSRTKILLKTLVYSLLVSLMVLFPLNVSGFPWIYLGYNLEINFLSDSKKIKVTKEPKQI